MSKKKYISSKVVLRSLTASRLNERTSRSNVILAVGIGLFIIGLIIVARPDWITSKIVGSIDFFVH
jgi:hypothetical protein